MLLDASNAEQSVNFSDCNMSHREQLAQNNILGLSAFLNVFHVHFNDAGS